MTSWNDFPSVPQHAFQWVPVFIEPMRGSGERLTALVVAVGIDGAYSVRVVLRAKILKCMYGDQGPKLLGMARLCERSLVEHLTQQRPLEAWNPPLATMTVGEQRAAVANNLEDVIRRAARLTASTSGTDLLEADPAEVDAGAPEVDHWIAQIRTSVVERAERLAPMFNQTVSVSAGAMSTRLGFSGARIAANFDALIPGNNFSTKRHRAKSRLLDLQALRDQIDLVQRVSYELMLWVPPAAMPIYSPKELEAVRSAFLELEEIGDKHEVRVVGLQSATDAADRILSAEFSTDFANAKMRHAPDTGAMVSLSQDHEVAYWASRFGVTEERLRQAVAAVGTSTEAVGNWLNGKR